MKKIGLIGGTGPESTMLYYKELNNRIDKMTGGKAMPELMIESVDFRKALNLVESARLDLLTDYVSEKVENLVRAGAEVVSLTAVTMHMVKDMVEKKTGVELVSIPKAVCEEALVRKYRKIGLLGTIATMEQNYMKNDFVDRGIEMVVPEKDDRTLVGKRIFGELELGIVKDSTLKEFNDIIARMKKEQGIEAVVLGCTELPLLLNNDNCCVPCLDSVDIHIGKLINLAIG